MRLTIRQSSAAALAFSTWRISPTLSTLTWPAISRPVWISLRLRQLPITWQNAIPGGSGTVVQVPPPFAWAAAYDHATPRTMQYMLNVQRQLSANWVLEVGYLGSQSRHLYGFQNINQAAPGPLASINSRRPFANFGVLSFVSDDFKGKLQLRKREAYTAFQPGHQLDYELHVCQVD